MSRKTKKLTQHFLATGFAIALCLLFFSPSALAKERVYGYPANTKDWPNFVAFSDAETDLLNRCSGVLLRPRWVLVAPSGCLSQRLESTRAWVGASRSSPYNGQKRAIKQVYLHPRYNTQQNDWAINPTWNIGLVKLKKPVYNIPRIRLSKRRPPVGSKITVAGLGNNTLVGNEDIFAAELLQSSLKVVSQKICKRYLPGQNQGHRSLFCAWSPYRGPCILDEGTGAFQGRTLLGLFNLIRDSESNTICPQKRGAGYYSAVAPALPWIRAVLNRGFDWGRFIFYRPYIHSFGEINTDIWLTQEVSGGAAHMRLSEKVCWSSRCYNPGRWIPLSRSLLTGARKSLYRTSKTPLLLRSKKKCVSGEVRVRFDYLKPGKPARKQFRTCAN